MSLQDTLTALTSTPASAATNQALTADTSRLADDARSILAALMVRPSADVRRMIDIFSPVAEAFLQDLITGRYPEASLALRAKYASLALARAGYGPIHNVRSVHAALTREDIEAIKQRAVSFAIEDSNTRQLANPRFNLKPPVEGDISNAPMHPTKGDTELARMDNVY